MASKASSQVLALALVGVSMFALTSCLGNRGDAHLEDTQWGTVMTDVCTAILPNQKFKLTLTKHFPACRKLDCKAADLELTDAEATTFTAAIGVVKDATTQEATAPTPAPAPGGGGNQGNAQDGSNRLSAAAVLKAMLDLKAGQNITTCADLANSIGNQWQAALPVARKKYLDLSGWNLSSLSGIPSKLDIDAIDFSDNSLNPTEVNKFLVAHAARIKYVNLDQNANLNGDKLIGGALDKIQFLNVARRQITYNTDLFDASETPFLKNLRYLNASRIHGLTFAKLSETLKQISPTGAGLTQLKALVARDFEETPDVGETLDLSSQSKLKVLDLAFGHKPAAIKVAIDVTNPANPVSTLAVLNLSACPGSDNAPLTCQQSYNRPLCLLVPDSDKDTANPNVQPNADGALDLANCNVYAAGKGVTPFTLKLVFVDGQGNMISRVAARTVLQQLQILDVRGYSDVVLPVSFGSFAMNGGSVTWAGISDAQSHPIRFIPNWYIGPSSHYGLMPRTSGGSLFALTDDIPTEALLADPTWMINYGPALSNSEILKQAQSNWDGPKFLFEMHDQAPAFGTLSVPWSAREIKTAVENIIFADQ